jgi:hypothetical protein
MAVSAVASGPRSPNSPERSRAKLTRTRSRAARFELTATAPVFVVPGARFVSRDSARRRGTSTSRSRDGLQPFGRRRVRLLRAHDSHPPLEYLLRLPLARMAANPFVFRLSSALCSVGALALFACWMRSYGRGRVRRHRRDVDLRVPDPSRTWRTLVRTDALIGVSTAVLADSWLRAPPFRVTSTSHS